MQGETEQPDGTMVHDTSGTIPCPLRIDKLFYVVPQDKNIVA